MALIGKRKNGQRYTKEGVIVSYVALTDGDISTKQVVAGLPAGAIVTGFTATGDLSAALTVSTGATDTTLTLAGGKVHEDALIVLDVATNIEIATPAGTTGEITVWVDFIDGTTTNGLRTTVA